MKTITLCCCLFISNLHHIKIVFGRSFFPCSLHLSRPLSLVFKTKNYMCACFSLFASQESVVYISVGLFSFFWVILYGEQRPIVADDIHSLSFTLSIGYVHIDFESIQCACVCVVWMVKGIRKCLVITRHTTAETSLKYF